MLQALTFFGTREKLGRAGYGAQVEEINFAAVKLAKEVAGDKALVAGSVSRTQLVEREGMGALAKARDHIAEQIRLLKDAGVDFLILETFFHLSEMKVALKAAAESGLPAVATMSFRPLVTQCSDGHTPAECARVMADLGAIAVGANCEQDPSRMLPLLREMRSAANVPIAAQPAAFRTTDECHSFTRLPRISRRFGNHSNFAAGVRRIRPNCRKRGHPIRWRLLRLQRRLHPLPRTGRESMTQSDQSAHAQCAIGIDVGGTKCAAGLVAFRRDASSHGGCSRPGQSAAASQCWPTSLTWCSRCSKRRSQLGVQPAAIGVGRC